jgi:hypothetical protein
VPLPTAKGRDSFPEKMQITGNNRGWLAETGSQVTAHTTTQSSRTAKTVLDRKEAVFGGDLAAYFQRSPVSADITVSRVDFLAPVSASKNSVPGDWISRSGGARESLPGFGNLLRI